MMGYDQFTPAPDERMLVVGRTGSGKTYLIKKIIEPLSTRQPIIIFDTKGTWKARRWWEDRKSSPYQFLGDPKVSHSLKPGLYIYRPDYPAYSDPKTAKVMLDAMKRHDMTLVFDETIDFARGTYAMPALAQCIQKGRELNVRMIMGTQRPASIPIICLTESLKFAVFRLRSIDDRKRMAQWVDPVMAENPGPGRHDFYWKDDGSDNERVVLIHQQ